MSELDPSGSVRVASPVGRGRGVALRVRRSKGDPAAWLTVVCAVGLVAAAGLAVFGMPPVDLHTPVHRMGIMDPLCGMTRGAAATVRGDLRKAWWYNPASPLVIAGGFLVVVRWVVGRLAGVWVDVQVRATPLVVAVAGLAVLLLEVNQQVHVDRLR